MVLYRGAPGPLAGPAAQGAGDLLILADAATVMLLGSAHGDAENGPTGGRAVGGGRAGSDLALHRAEIDQATGMLTVQLEMSRPRRRSSGCGPTRLEDRRLADVVSDIVARQLAARDQDPGQAARDRHPGRRPPRIPHRVTAP